MSEYSTLYNFLKNDDSDKIYLFHNGNFFCFINDDAKLINQKIGLNLTKWGNTMVKCGFPSVALETYLKDLQEKNINYQIIDNNKKIKKEDESNYVQEIKKLCQSKNNTKKYIEIGKEIENLNIANLTAVEALNLITQYQNKLLN